jgi:hypothetical protein
MESKPNARDGVCVAQPFCDVVDDLDLDRMPVKFPNDDPGVFDQTFGYAEVAHDGAHRTFFQMKCVRRNSVVIEKTEVVGSVFEGVQGDVVRFFDFVRTVIDVCVEVNCYCHR